MDKKKVFISYADLDKSKMRSLQKIISKYDSIIPIVIADNRQALIQLTKKVSDGIFNCDFFVPILTKNSLVNQWVNQEIGFATALNKRTIPIIEKQIADDLKGFIHKQLDLSYSYYSNVGNKLSEAVSFTNTARLLVKDILNESESTTKVISLETLFPGKWESEFIIDNKKYKEYDIEIKEGNKYYTKGVHWFDLNDSFIDMDKKIIRFKKNGLKNDTRQVFNDLRLNEIGKQYEGTEMDKERNVINIKYYRKS